MKAKIMEVISKYQDQCDLLEIRLEESQTRFFNLHNLEVQNLNGGIDTGASVRVFKDGGVGFVAFNNLEELEEMVLRALQIAGLNKTSLLSLLPLTPVREEIQFQSETDPRNYSLQWKIERLKKYVQQALDYGAPVCKVRVEYFEKFLKTTLATSTGSYLVQERMNLLGAIAVHGEQDGQSEHDFLKFHSTSGVECLEGLESEVTRICQLVSELVTAPAVPAGEYTIVMDGVLTGLFVHEAFGHLAEADRFIDEETICAFQELEFANTELHVYDTGDLCAYPGSFKYDDEGVLARKVDLIKDGRITERLHTRSTAARLGEIPTGNARTTSYQFSPIPRMRATLMAPGQVPFAEMIQDIERGIYLVKAKGGQNRGEEFILLSLYGYLIESGQLTTLVKGVIVSGTVFDFLNQIDKIGDTATFIYTPTFCGKGEQTILPVCQGAPCVRVQGVRIGGSQ